MEYSAGLTDKIRAFAGGTFAVLLVSYNLFKNFDPATGVMTALNAHSVAYRFRFFES